MNFGIGSNKEIKNDVAPSTFLLRFIFYRILHFK